MHRWSSRKFLLSLAAFLGSVATSIAGIATKSDTITILGVVCGVISAAVYAAVEAWTDAANATKTDVWDQTRTQIIIDNPPEDEEPVDEVEG